MFWPATDTPCRTSRHTKGWQGPLPWLCCAAKALTPSHPKAATLRARVARRMSQTSAHSANVRSILTASRPARCR